MAGNLKLKTGSTVTCVSSGAGTIVGGAAQIANASSNLINATNLDSSVTAVLTCACASAPTQGKTVSLYLVPKADASNIASVDSSTPYFSPNYFAGYFYWPPASAATSQIMAIPAIPLEAYDYVPYLVNSLSQTISTTWSLAFYGTTAQYT